MRERILVVDDNKALAKLIAKKMEQHIDMDIVVAHSLKEAKEILEENDDFFVALLDLNLPDAPNGEIVDYVLDLGILVIVLTGSMDKETRDTFVNKDIVDYVVKSNMNNITYIFDMINRISTNRSYKIMVVDSKLNSRQEIRDTLRQMQFKVFAAAHGEEALSYLKDNPDIKFILTENKMPVINGFDLMQQIRQSFDNESLSIIAMLESDEKEEAAKFIKNGANDIIFKPFDKEELVCRMNSIVDSYELANFKQKAKNCDYLTLLPNRTYFYKFLKNTSKTVEKTRELTVAALEINHPNEISANFSDEMLTYIIKIVSQIIMKHLGNAGIISRFGGVNFRMGLYNISYKDAAKELINIIGEISTMNFTYDNSTCNISVNVGLSSGYFSDKPEVLVSRACEALSISKISGENRVEAK